MKINPNKHTIQINDATEELKFLKTEKIMIKEMSFDELNISLERLLRFKAPFMRNSRVYREIIIRHFIHPKISLKTYNSFCWGEILQLTQLVWNNSVKKIFPQVEEDYKINLYLLYEEMKAFYPEEMLKRLVFSENIKGFTQPANFSESEFVYEDRILRDIFDKNGIVFNNNQLQPYENTTKLREAEKTYIHIQMNHPINISGFLHAASAQKNLTPETSRLTKLNNFIKERTQTLEEIYNFAEKYREENSACKPYRMIVMVEGSTEEILLPVFCRLAGVNFNKEGVFLISAGGKNQSERIYSTLRQETDLPIFIILDSDAVKTAEEIKLKMRLKDCIHLISAGEFEDILSDTLICRAINSFCKDWGLSEELEPSQIALDASKAHVIENIWKQKGFGEFKKAEFASLISRNILSERDLSPEMREISVKIKEMLI